MIVGVGTDMVDARRMERLLTRFGARLAEKLLHASEREALQKAPTPMQLAKRFAAKEAYAKARGTGFRGGFTLQDVRVTHTAAGQPKLVFSDAETARFPGHAAHLSISDEAPYALAYVVLEKTDRPC